MWLDCCGVFVQMNDHSMQNVIKEMNETNSDLNRIIVIFSGCCFMIWKGTPVFLIFENRYESFNLFCMQGFGKSESTSLKKHVCKNGRKTQPHFGGVSF